MRNSRFIFVFVLLTFAKSATAQLATAPTPQAAVLLQQSLTALSGGHPLIDVTLSGTVQRIAGSDDETGTVVFKALPTGESRMDLSFPSGARSEVRANSSSGPVGSWSGPDATPHPISQHNLWTDSSWFFPAFTLVRLLADPSYIVSYAGRETRNDQVVEHLTVSRKIQAMGAPAGWTSSIPELSRTDIYLDSATFLPSAVVFNTHPDRNDAINIPVEYRLSAYQQTNGALVPSRIQKYFNNSLALDIHISAVTPNTGLSAPTFNVQ